MTNLYSQKPERKLPTGTPSQRAINYNEGIKDAVELIRSKATRI
jgi:hypothetical protein